MPQPVIFRYTRVVSSYSPPVRHILYSVVCRPSLPYHAVKFAIIAQIHVRVKPCLKLLLICVSFNVQHRLYYVPSRS